MQLRLTYGARIITSPVVPRYTPTSRPAELSTPTVPSLGADAFGAGLGEGIRRAAQSVAGIVKDGREKADRTAAINSRTALDQTEVDLLYNPNTGALTRRGQQSFNVDVPTLQAFDKKVTEIEGNLATPEQKQTFSFMAAQRRAEINKQLQRHISGELQTYADESNKASLESTLNNVSTNFQDPDRVEQERKYGLAVIMSDTDNKGLPPSVVKARVDSWESSVHTAVIDRLAVDNPVKALEYFDANRDKMSARDAAKKEKELKPLATKQVGMDTALELSPLLGTKPLTEVLGEVRTRLKSNPDALNIAETQLKQMEAERRDQLKQEADAAAKPVYKRIAEIQLSGRAAKLSDIPAAEWAEMVRKAPEEAGKIQDAIRRELQGEEDRRERKADREERRQDRAERKAEQGTMAQMLNWAALNGDPDSLLQANLDALYTQRLIGKEHYRSLSTKQADLRANPDKGTAIRSESQTVEDVLGAVKLKQGSEEHAAAWDFIESRKRMFVAENNRQPSRKELQDLARESIYKVDVAGSVFDKPLYQIGFDDIPKKERAKIVDAFNRRGKTYTEADVVRAYGRAQSKGGK